MCLVCFKIYNIVTSKDEMLYITQSMVIYMYKLNSKYVAYKQSSQTHFFAITCGMTYYIMIAD